MTVSAFKVNVRQFSQSDIAQIKYSKDREEIGGWLDRCWVKVCDFFCGTNQEEAQKILFDLYSPNSTSTESQKFESFFKLQKWVCEENKHLFQHVKRNDENKECCIIKLAAYGFGDLVISRDAFLKESLILDRVPLVDEKNRDEAKKCLYELHSPMATDLEKIKNFSRLKNLAAEDFKGRFEHCKKNSDGKETYSLKLGVSEIVDDFSLSRKIIKSNWPEIKQEIVSMTNEEGLAVINVDIGRADYYVGGHQLTGDRDARLRQYHEKLKALGCSIAQRSVISKICNQALAGIIMMGAAKKDESGGILEAPPDCLASCDTTLEYRIGRNDNGLLNVQFHYYKDVASLKNEMEIDAALEKFGAPGFEGACKSVEIKFEANIFFKGNIDIKNVQYIANEDLAAINAPLPEDLLNILSSFV